MKKQSLVLSILFLISTLGFAAPLPANEVFKLSAQKLDPNTFVLNWTIEPGYFLYRDRISVTSKTNTIAHLGDIQFPKFTTKTDRTGHTYSVYRDVLKLPVPVLGKDGGETLVTVHYQGCSDAGFCYPPQMAEVQLTIQQSELIKAALETDASNTTPAEDDSEVSLTNPLFSSHHWAAVIFGFFGFGLLLAFTPCVLPMVPILSGIIVGHGHKLTRRKSFFLSLSYVLSMSVTYAIVGAVIASMGSNLQIIMQSPWAIGLFSLIFVLLALSMFDMYELRLPVSWQSKLGNLTRSQASGHYLSAAFMGAMSTLIISPCVTAPMIGALSYIANTGNILFGTLALFFLGLGMGIPLLLVGLSAGKLLPKAGQWMNKIKFLFGILFLGIAIYLLSRILPGLLIMALWACLLVFSGIYLGALRKSRNNQERFFQGLGILLSVYGLLILIGASQGNTNPLQPLAKHTMDSDAHQINKIMVKTLQETQTALHNAEGKPVMLDFYADWCASCKVIEATTMKNAAVQSLLNHFVVIQADVTENNENSRALLQYFNVVAPPTFIFFNQEGHELTNQRIIGDIAVNRFIKKLNRLKGGPNT